MKPNKYRNIKCKHDGISFDSKREMKRYHYLKLMEDKGLIKNLQVHPKYKLILPDGTPIMIRSEKRNTNATYTADFMYVDEQGNEVIEDVKSKITLNEYSFKLKRGIFEAIYKKEIKLVV